jgi:predicted amidohydrolase YtcJ
MRYLKVGSSICVFMLIGMLIQSCKSKQKVALIVHHAVIYTVDSAFSVAEAMAIDNGKIVSIGSNQSILEAFQSDSMVDVAGKTIVPGFIDAHCHFTGYATDSWKCDVTGTDSFEEVVEKIKNYSATAPTEWIYGRGWDQNDWADKTYPNKKVLDSLFPNRPVFLKRIDGHAALVNQKALDIAGVNQYTKVAGGSVEIKNGVLTGILLDNAMDLVDSKIPAISDELAKKYFLQLQQRCFAFGLTGVHDCGISEHTVDLIDQEQKAGRLQLKIFALLTDSAQYYDRWIQKGPYKTDRLHVGGFKLYADGALGSRGACLLSDYSDKKNWHGFLLSDKNHFKTIAQKLAASSFQMCTHAIGDSGNKEILKIYSAVLPKENDRRWRIEHAQVIDPEDFSYFGGSKIIPSVQPTHATSDMYWAEERLGDSRIKTAYAYQQLLKENGWMPLGTDFPVEDINPFKTFYAAVVRKDSKGFPADGFQKENALTREQALRGMTIWAAKAAFEEKEKGSLEVGKAADFIILDKDIMKVPEDNLLNISVIRTFLNGEEVFRR